MPSSETDPETPKLLQRLLLGKNIDAEVEYVIHPGFTLEMHFNTGEIQNKFLTKKYDFVVMQPYSIEALELPECFAKLGPKGRANFLEYGQKIVSLIRENGAEPLIFEPWTYDEGHRWMQADFECLRFPDGSTWYGDSLRAYRAKLKQGYEMLQDVTDAEIIPIGDAWWTIRKSRRPDVSIHQLYENDHYHPTYMGAYLSALVIAEHLVNVPASKFLYEPSEVPHLKAKYLKKVAEGYLLLDTARN